MINFLIFSKDRACQLQLLLRSIERNIKFMQPRYNVTVLYKETEEHKLSYDLLMSNAIPDGVNFVKQEDFKKDCMTILRAWKYTCLLTDDSYFFRPANFVVLPEENETFSFRLGYNTVIQDHIHNTLQPPLLPDGMKDNIIFWNPSKYPNNCNFGYPYSFDGHIYKSRHLIDRLADVGFNSTNDMEGILHSKRELISTIYSFTHSRLVNIPCNNISGLTKAGAYHSYSMDYLNKLFLAGKSIKIKEGIPIIGCHQELEFEVV